MSESLPVTDESSQEMCSTLRILSYNIQAGSYNQPGYHRYVTDIWQQFLPHPRQINNLNRIAELLNQIDIAALQEIDGGSFRSGFINQIKYLAEKASFPYWHQQLNRNLGKLAQHSNAVLSRWQPTQITNHKLPGVIPGRGAILLKFGEGPCALIIIVVHLALSSKAQKLQLSFISEIAREYQHVIVMGDMNCSWQKLADSALIQQQHLRPANFSNNTFPSWAPRRNIDHILVSETIAIEKVEILPIRYSDHLPITISVVLPAECQRSFTV